MMIGRISQLIARWPGVWLGVAMTVIAACQTVEQESAGPAPAADPKGQPTETAPAEAKAPPADSKPAPAAAAVAANAGYERRWEERKFEAIVTGSCISCHGTLPRKQGRPTREHLTSAHYRAGVSCADCHGGDPSKDEHEEAHNEAMGFIGKPDKGMMDERCGKCHQQEVQTFMASKHFLAHENVNEVNCVTCHSAHVIGAREKEFSWPKTCAECHDLDQVKDLPANLVALMASKDGVLDKMRELRYKLENKPFPPEAMEPYREVRQLSADIVHSTRAAVTPEETEKVVAKDKALEEKLAAMLAQ